MSFERAAEYLDSLPDWETGPPPPGPPETYLPRMRELLARIGDPQDQFRSVIVTGTNGKGTTASLLADVLIAHGHKVGLFSSPHFHTIRERIQIQRVPVDVDQWTRSAAAIARVAPTVDPPLDSITKFEALTAMAVESFANAEVEFGVFEVGLGGRFDSTNAWDSELAILTRVGLDHTEVLGDTVEAIAHDKLHVSRAGRPLVTTAEQSSSVLEIAQTFHRDRGVVYVCHDEHVSRSDSAEAIPYVWQPATDASRPEWFLENARLAVAAAQLLLNSRISADTAAAATAAHFWPGRFEVARDEPLIILDGAHNEPAAASLATELSRRGSDWTLVVGVNHGHDARAILGALGPVSRQIIAVSSGHPKAQAVSSVLDAIPVPVVSATADSVGSAIELACGDQAPRICVTGSLHVVARAREFLGLEGSDRR